ncbi:DNA cytosine methyltransferase [Chryseobacterium sp. 2VB]|uniref:DNA cytosine methyltransferase n=1 Tax=Chryseobacterium sp. 2VB TaxID=2502204 RepID=UPI0010F4ACCE|nr:DNA cytosine methyltransferase [Chryseobacterium sp. 2VB]
MKILNLYACLGGNRYKWDEVANAAGIEMQVTAVELDPELARLYQERFPNDIVIVEDAHQYLLDHYKEFDFIWSSPPCPTHSRARYWNASNYDTTTEPVYPDMVLYQEIIFLHHYFKTGKYVVENVIPYYEPLIDAQKRGRHLYWSNINLPAELGERKFKMSGKEEVRRLCEFHDYDFYQYKGEQRIDKIGRNLVDYEAGKTIFECVLRKEPKRIINSLFDNEYLTL